VWLVHDAHQRPSAPGLLDAGDKVKQPIALAPLSKFPVVRDLMVDRGQMSRR